MSADPLLEIGAFATDLVVQAGAGTGKTHALVTLYLHLLTGLGARPEPVPPARILVITFTDKAAGELRDRIRARLTKLCSQGFADEPALRESAQRTGRALPDESVLRAALGDLTRAPIGTFHATGQALLRRRAIVAGLDPGFALLDAVEAELRATEAARAVALDALALRDPGTEALVDQLGFGGRERRGLVEGLAWLRGVLAEEGRAATGIADAYEPARLEHEQAIARAELRAALDDVGALAERLGGKSVANARSAAACSVEDLDVVARIGASMKLLRPPKDDGVAESLDNARARVTAACKALDEARAAIELGPSARAIEKLVVATEQHYAAAKRANQLVDFGDLIRIPRDLLRARPELACEEAARYDAILVDEFQDTNAVQAELVELLAGAATNIGRRFIVGDRKQSIYEFRGADVGVFTRTARELRERGAHEVLLRRSFRSSPEVIALCNALFASAFDAGSKAKEPWALEFDPARDALEPTRDDAHDAAVELLETVDIDVKLPADVQRRREAEAIAAHMRRCLDEGRAPGELVLLLRRYTHLPAYLHALRKAGIPYYVVRGRGFYEAQEVRDLASLLALLSDSSDRVALVAVLRSPLGGLSDDALALLAHGHALDLASIRRGVGVTLGAVDAARLETLRDRLRALEPLIEHLGPEALLREIIERWKLVEIFASTPDGMQKIANVEQLVLRAGMLERDGRSTADLSGFSRWLARAVRPQSALDEAEAQIVDERADVVRVMTIHQSKGLEFPVVYVADCGSPPRNVVGPIHYDADEGLGLGKRGQHSTASRRVSELRKRRGRAESLRLFYVAATRARDRLVFSGEGVGDTWRRALDAVLDRLTLVPRFESQPLAVTPPPPRAIDVATLAALQPLVPSHARSLRIAVTQLHDFALCARRYHLVHELGLDEARPGARRAALSLDDDLALDPRNAGTFAHRLLERCTFGLPASESRAEIERLVESFGHERGDPATMAIVEHVLAFLRQDFAQALAGKAVRRELSFTLSLPTQAGALRTLRGQMDLVVLDSDGIAVVDYKHARRGALDEYRFQLEAYAVAAATLYPRAPRVRVGLVYLRDDDPRPHWVDVRATDVLTTELARTAEALVEARLSNERPLALRATCDEIGCGFATWCHR